MQNSYKKKLKKKSIRVNPMPITYLLKQMELILFHLLLIVIYNPSYNFLFFVKQIYKENVYKKQYKR